MRPANLDTLTSIGVRPVMSFVQLVFAQMLIVMVCLAIILTSTGPGLTQNTDTQVTVLPPAYNSQMLRLAEILGAIHYLRNLCGADEGMLWREQMENIVENEKPTPQRKAEIISRFNRGFRTYREIHHECTATTIEAVNLYMRQGRRLAGEIPARFGVEY